MDKDIIYALELKKDLSGEDYLKISFIGGVTDKWLKLFDNNCDEYNKFKPYNSFGWRFSIPLPVRKENEEFILQCVEDGIDNIDYSIGSNDRKCFQEAMDSVISRTNIQIKYM